MLAPAVMFWQFVLALHILAVVAGFGVVFAYPVFVLVGRRLDPSAMPWFHRMQAAVGQRVINPGLTVVVLAGIYLAADLHQWKQFYVQWGIAAALVIGAIEGSVMIRGEKRLAELAERDVAASGGSGGAGTATVTWSEEYLALYNRLAMWGGLLVGIIVVTIFLMTVQA